MCIYFGVLQKPNSSSAALCEAWSERIYILGEKKKKVITLTFIFSALSCVAITSHSLSRVRLREGFEGN